MSGRMLWTTMRAVLAEVQLALLVHTRRTARNILLTAGMVRRQNFSFTETPVGPDSVPANGRPSDYRDFGLNPQRSLSTRSARCRSAADPPERTRRRMETRLASAAHC